MLAGCASRPDDASSQGSAATLAWRAVAPGLSYAVASPWPDSRVHLLRMDLREATLALVVSAHEARGATLPALVEQAGPSAVVAAVNASFFDRSWAALGWTVSGGRAWPDAMRPQTAPLLACDAAQRCAVVFEPPAAPSPRWAQAVGGTPWLVRAGQPRTPQADETCAALCARAHPRTAAGLSGQGRWLWLVLVEGRRPPVAGVALAPLAQWLAELGVDDALNLDGGGSSMLWLQGSTPMARPANEPQARALANGLLILRRGDVAAGP
jgi:hypothetical protein